MSSRFERFVWVESELLRTAKKDLGAVRNKEAKVEAQLRAQELAKKFR